jgi:hypothetical protein
LSLRTMDEQEVFLGGMGRGPAARGQSADGIDRIDLAPFPAP